MKNDAEQNALIKEVWDGVREQNVVNFLKAYWKHIATGLVVFFLTLAGIQLYNGSKINSQLEETALFEKVLSRSGLNSNDRNAVLKTLVSTGNYGYQGIALLMQADTALKNGDEKKAISLLKESKDKINVSELKNLVILKLAFLEADEISYEGLKKLLSPLLEKDEAFYSSATLLLGVKAMDVEKNDEALEFFNDLIDAKSTPFSIRMLAKDMKNAL